MSIVQVCLRFEIEESAPLIDLTFNGKTSTKMSKRNATKSQSAEMLDKSKLRGKREIRPLTVETHLAANQSTSTTTAAVSSKNADSMPFFSGNPFVEKTRGILHIFKQNDSVKETGTSEMLCMLAVPAVMTSHDLLQFLAPAGPTISQIRIIRDASPNQYMVLIRFRIQASADEFYKSYQGRPFNSIEPELCHLVYVERVEMMKESEGGDVPIDGHTELPTCPVCLERMDESVDGILTILCNHAFHANCLNQWGDSSCPVCRYVQTPELTPDHKCFVCGKQQDLWICLICGHIGCGRYAEAHAVLHFQETQHTFSLEVGGQRVWDYAGDNYVHRLIQSKSDGKVVEFDNSQRAADVAANDEKLDGITLEYTYLLTNQLESQRLYFEEKLAKIEKLASAQIEDLLKRVEKTSEELEKMQKELKKCASDKNGVDRKLAQTLAKLNKCQEELKEEQTMNELFRNDQKSWTTKTKTLEENYQKLKESKEKEIAELQEQLRDLMFHFEAEAKLKDSVCVEGGDNNTDIREARLVVGDAPTAPTRKSSRKKHK